MKIQSRLEEMLEAATNKNVSDIYFFARSDNYAVQFKEAHGLNHYTEFTLALGSELINYLKYHAKMDITEHRRPQVGSFQLLGLPYFLRLSSVGDYRGQESLVMRIIYHVQEAKYYFQEDFTSLSEICEQRGLVLTSGPTGSGKTTLMYQLAKVVGAGKIVMCLEDPVEIQEPTFFQAQVNLEAGITYSALLKAALRHRPDILILGEIRDSETAKLAVRASLSGHLVLATVHAMSTKGAVMRMLDLGVSKSELLNSLRGLTYQRLIADSEGKLRCLVDFGSGKLLEPVVKSPSQGFFSWNEKLTKLVSGGVVSETNARKYESG